MHKVVSRGHHRITALVCDTARIINGITTCITARITACVTRRITEHDAIGLDAEAAWIPIILNSFPWNEFSESSIQRASQQHLQTVSTK